METKVYKRSELFAKEYKSLKKIKRAEKLAWFFFFGIGIAYIALTLIIHNA